MAILRLIILLTTVSSVSIAQEVQDIMSCAILNGNLSHKIYKEDGNFKSLVSFPVIRIRQSEEEIEARKKAYRESIENNTPPPEDNREIGVSIPLNSSNILSSDLDFLRRKAEFFNSIFPNRKRFFPDMGKLFLDFEEGCDVKKVNGLTSVSCLTSSVREINGVPIDHISITMENVRTSQLYTTSERLQDSDGQKNITSKSRNTVLTSITFVSKNVSYKSEFTYFPNGNDRACSVYNKKLKEFEAKESPKKTKSG